MRLVFVLLPLAACTSGSASVEVEGIEGFGAAASAIWLVTPVVEMWEFELASGTATYVGDAEFSPLAIRDFTWSCAEDRAYLADFGAASAQVVSASEDGDAAGVCEGVTALEALRGRKPEAWRILNAHTGAVSATEEPQLGDFAGQGDASLVYEGDDGDACATWDADTCQYVGGDDTCGNRDEAWLVELDELVIDNVGLHVSGTLGGTLLAEDDTAAGRVDATFDAALCEVPAVGQLIVGVH